MYVCTYVWTRVCACMCEVRLGTCVCVRVWRVCTYIRVHVCTSVSEDKTVCTCVCHVCVWTRVLLCGYVCGHVRECARVYVRVCVGRTSPTSPTSSNPGGPRPCNTQNRVGSAPRQPADDSPVTCRTRESSPWGRKGKGRPDSLPQTSPSDTSQKSE